MSISSDSNFITPAGAAPEPEDASIGQSTQNPYQCAETNPIHATTAGRSYWTATLLGTSTEGTET